MALVELNQLGEWIIADDICIEYKEEAAGVIRGEQLLSEAEWTGSSKGLRLQRACNFDTILEIILATC